MKELIEDLVNEEINGKLKQENRQLQDNWIKLKEYIQDFILETYEYIKPYGKIYRQGQIDVSHSILLKMFELERKWYLK